VGLIAITAGAGVLPDIYRVIAVGGILQGIWWLALSMLFLSVAQILSLKASINDFKFLSLSDRFLLIINCSSSGSLLTRTEDNGLP